MRTFCYFLICHGLSNTKNFFKNSVKGSLYLSDELVGAFPFGYDCWKAPRLLECLACHRGVIAASFLP